MSDKGHPVIAAVLDVVMFSLRKPRARLVAEARGKVLEIGVGTGLNFRHYNGIESLEGIEPDPHMLARAQKRAARRPFPVNLQRCGAEALPFADATFDTVVGTWVLCTIPEYEQALKEMLRVLKPGGRLLFVEHTRSRFRRAEALQDQLTPVWRKVAGNCHLNRDSLTHLRSTGFDDIDIQPLGRESWTLFPMYRGSAVKPG